MSYRKWISDYAIFPTLEHEIADCTLWYLSNEENE